MTLKDSPSQVPRGVRWAADLALVGSIGIGVRRHARAYHRTRRAVGRVRFAQR